MDVAGWVRPAGRVDWPRVLLVALAVAVVLGVGTAAAVSFEPFSPYNPTWEGTGDFTDEVVRGGDHAGEVMWSPGYDGLAGEGTVAFVVAPTEAYAPAEAAAIAAYLDRGGTLVVLDGFGGHGDALLADVGATARFDGRVLRDDRHHAAGPVMPVADAVTPHALTVGVERLTLNHGTAIDPGGATVLVATSEFAYLGPALDDVDEDDLTSYPVATVEAVGEGTVVAVGDPSITIDAMLGEPDNRAFLTRLAADADRVVYDVSNAAPVPPVRLGLLWLRASTAAQALVGLLAVAAVALARRGVGGPLGRLRARLRGARPAEAPGLAPADAAAYLRRRHPDWDAARIERVMAGLKGPPGEPGGEDDER